MLVQPWFLCFSGRCLRARFSTTVFRAMFVDRVKRLNIVGNLLPRPSCLRVDKIVITQMYTHITCCCFRKILMVHSVFSLRFRVRPSRSLQSFLAASWMAGRSIHERSLSSGVLPPAWTPDTTSFGDTSGTDERYDFFLNWKLRWATEVWFVKMNRHVGMCLVQE